MTKLAIVVLAFATIVAAVSGYRTTITTTITNGHGGTVCGFPYMGCFPDGLDNGKSATTTTIEDNSTGRIHCVPFLGCRPDGLDNPTIEDNGTGGTVCGRSGCYPDGLDNPTCGDVSQMAELKHCQMHLQQQGSEKQHLGSCCNQLQQLKQQCQCEAIKQVVQQASAAATSQKQHMLRRKAEMLPNQCNLKIHKSCPIFRIPSSVVV